MGAPKTPAYWLACLSEVIFSSGASKALPTGGAAGSSGGGSGGAPPPRRSSQDAGMLSDDEEAAEDRATRALGAGGAGAPEGTHRAAASAAGTAGGGPGAHNAGDDLGQQAAALKADKGRAAPAGREAGHVVRASAVAAAEGAEAVQALLARVALRLRTRLFAAELLQRMLQVGGRVNSFVCCSNDNDRKSKHSRCSKNSKSRQVMWISKILLCLSILLCNVRGSSACSGSTFSRAAAKAGVLNVAGADVLVAV